MIESLQDEFMQPLGVIALAVIATFIGAQKLLKEWRSTNAETNIITIMHTELERMSEQNTALSIELGRLHNEVIALNQQLQKLTIENQRLQTEVMALTNEVSMFKTRTRKESYGTF
jgi:predicted nuclease with TOPRIM domain